jgi:hypothetical protein
MGNACYHSVQRACSIYGRQARGAYRILVGRPEGKRFRGRLRRRWRVILKWIFKKWDVEAWTGLIGPGTRTGGSIL